MADWSSLSRDLLEKIGEKLFVSPRSYARTRAVCVHWRSSLPKKPWTSWPLHESIPSLIFPPEHYNTKQQHCRLHGFLSLFGIGACKDDRGCGFLSLFDIAADKDLNYSPLELPGGEVLEEKDVAKDNLIFKGCSHGWIIAVGYSLQIYLINLSLPFQDRLVRLPPITSSHVDIVEYRPSRVGKEYKCMVYRSHREHFIRKSSKSMRDSFIKKVVLSSSSPSAPNTIAMVIVGQFNDVFVCRLRGDPWTDLGSGVKDIIYSNNHFFLLVSLEFRGGAVKVVSLPDLLTNPYPKLKWIPVRRFDMFRGKYPIQVYLVTSPDDDLLYVTRYHVDKTTAHFRVFNFLSLKYYSSTSSSFNDDEQNEEEMESLGDNVLFLGYKDSWCVPSCNLPSNFLGPKMNCIYFTNDHYSEDEDEDEDGDGCSDMVSIFDYENKTTISPFLGYTHNPDFPRPIWFMP